MLVSLLAVLAAGAAVALFGFARVRARHRDAASRWAATAKVSVLLAEALDARAVLTEALRLLVPHFADWCALHVVDEDAARRVALVHAVPEVERMLTEGFGAFAFDPRGPSGPARVIRNGEAELRRRVRDADIADQPEPLRRLAAAVDLQSSVIVPLKARKMTVGALSLMRGGQRPPFDADDLAWAQDLGHRIGLAIENARLYADARELFGQTISANFVSTPDGRILACNRTFASLLGFDSVEAVMALSADEFYPQPGDRERLLDELRSRRRLTNYEHTIRRRDGRAIAVSENAVGTFDDRGELVKISGFMLDRSEQKNLEDQLRASQRLEAVGQLAGGIAHDFNNLLTVIIGCADLLRAEGRPPPADGHDPLEELVKAAQRAAGRTHQLLAFSRRQVLQPRVLDLNDALRHVHSMLRRLVRDNVVLVLDLDPAIERVRVDPGQLDQVVVNLVVNAGDAMPEGGTVTLSTRNTTLTDADRVEHPFVAPGAFVILAVRDTGVGMDEATRARAFEPFFSTKPVGKGTGLGLSTVYGIVKQSGGYVWLTSEPDAGTAVTVCLPVAANPV